MNKFIITQGGCLRFGDVLYHKDLIPEQDYTCLGGGFWAVDNQRGIIVLYGQSYDFGKPDFSRLRGIDRSSVPASLGYPIFYKFSTNGEEILEPVNIS